MYKFLLPVIVVLLVHNIVLAEAEPWEISVDANLTLTLNTYSSSWAGDETGSFSWASQVIFLAA